MYLRIMNKLDYIYGQSYIDDKVSDADCYCAIMREIDRIVTILDASYGGDRKVTDYGGWLFVITDIKEAMIVRADILNYYKLVETEYEYSEVIAENEDIEWVSELFLRTSEDSISIIYARKKEVEK